MDFLDALGLQVEGDMADSSEARLDSLERDLNDHRRPGESSREQMKRYSFGGLGGPVRYVYVGGECVDMRHSFSAATTTDKVGPELAWIGGLANELWQTITFSSSAAPLGGNEDMSSNNRGIAWMGKEILRIAGVYEANHFDPGRELSVLMREYFESQGRGYGDDEYSPGHGWLRF